VVVANHPYGILDGLMMGRILSERRGGDFRVMAHRVFCRSADLERVILPINFDETKEAARQNIETRAEALRYLGGGGAIGIFPGGTVSTAARPFDRPMDPGWRTFTAKMIARTEATVVPVFFDGHNSRLFQLASHVHYTLRLGMLIREFRTRVGTPVRVVVGAPVPRAELDARRGDPKALMDFLRRSTYDLSPKPLQSNRLGHEFEAKYRGTSDGGGDLRQRLGGLTVLDAIQKRLPELPLVYYGDNAHAPYGVRTADDIYDLTVAAVGKLFDHGCDLVILACNTASAAALRRMQEGWVPHDKRVLGVFVPLIEALTERQWGDNSPRARWRSSMWRCSQLPRRWRAARSSGNWRSARSGWMSRRRPAAGWWMPSRMAT
jgi:hypothetical protein